MILYKLFDWISGTISFSDMILSLIFSLVAILLIFPVHEYAHGLMALIMGDKTAKHQGRLTLNPLAHIDLRGFLFLLIFGFGWANPVQFNPTYFKNRRLGTILTAAAGPLSNIIFCFISLLIYGILNVYGSLNGIAWLETFSVLFYYMTVYNASFAIFNLIPFPPLDGSKIVGELLPLKTRFKYYSLERYSYLFFIALIIILNRTDFLSLLSNKLIYGFLPIVNSILGGIFG